ncbi:hypothetical protein LDENG_00140800 [Lucifuga dentata]|nr:hypothetical protein LDENG_00140800 [Lucifuga dentata]
MSLLTAVEEAIKSYKAEQARINERILLYKEILQIIAPKPQKGSLDSECAEDAATDIDISPGEKEEIELLERALEKALRIRTGIEPSKKNPDRHQQSLKEPGGTDVKPKKVTQASAVFKGNQVTIKSNSKATCLNRKEHKKPGMSELAKLGSRSGAGHHPGRNKSTVKSNLIKKHPVSSTETVHHQGDRKAQQVVSNSGSLDQDQAHNSTFSSKYNATGSSDEDLSKAATTPTPCLNNAELLSHSAKTEKQPQQNRIPLEQAVKWKCLISKQNRLWDKVMAVQRKPVPGRSRFMERMRATFPEDLACGSPNQTRGQVDQLTHQGQDLIQYFHTIELLSKQAGTEPGTSLNTNTHKDTNREGRDDVCVG